ncbi:branched-chain amino acid ABC transporter permease [Bacilliculturomica massiliensis]|uniref:branched-chain amino acid ABC transporter permease n=1 Tax=Bacilliculturomica massiliensis TaxID=1917867 RepID=UPI00103106E0|nr:branched-chain amino acid ABC transporter permease [Bacilliculturomica massiliensis]
MFSWFYIEGILILVGINVMIVLGLSLLTGFTGLFSFGHAGFMAIGAYVAVTCTMQLDVPFYLAILIGGIAAMIASLFIGYFTLNLKGDYFCIATLGFGEAIRLILDNMTIVGGARGLPGIPLDTTLVNVIVIDIIGIMAMAYLIKSRHGRNMIAIREEELASQAIGINVFRYKMESLAISALYAGIGGALWAHYVGFIQPLMFQLTKSTEMTIMVIFGGLGSITGSVVGAFILTFLPELLRELANWRLVFYGAAVIAIMIARPQGMLGGIEITDMFRWIKRTVTGENRRAKAAAEADKEAKTELPGEGGGES